MIHQGDLSEKFGQFTEQWQPKIVATLNGQDVKLVKAAGTFPWHVHQDCDEMFLVWRGRFRIEFRDRAHDLTAGQFLVVPRGVEHRTLADAEAEVMIFEPEATINTGDQEASAFTAPQGVRI